VAFPIGFEKTGIRFRLST